MVNINTATLAAVPLLEGLQAEDLAALIPQIQTRTYEKGETLFLTGDPGGALLIVVSGVVELFVYDENQNRIVLNQVGGGGFFGEVSLFDNGPRTANAFATETTEILVLRQEVMVDFLRRHPDAGIHVINILSRRLRDNTSLLINTKDRQENIWDQIADRLAFTVGSWRYLALLIFIIALWVVLNLSQMLGVWDRPIEFNVLNLLLTIVGALQVPLILMSQRRQDAYAQIAADLEYQVNLKAQLSILEVTRKLDWLREAMMDQTTRLERLESDHPVPQDKEEPGDDHEAEHNEAVNSNGAH